MLSLKNLHYHCEEQREYLRLLIEKIMAFYGLSLVSLAIFGSMARGENRATSDCDLLVVLADQPARHHHQKIGEFVDLELSLFESEQAMVEQGTAMEISPTILTRTQARTFNPLYLDMTTHSLLLYDRDNFLQSVLETTRQKMKKWGSRKVFLAHGWCWDIKPDLKWGEIIDYDQ